ncbi:hypothetical protein, partial [Petrachloros mirabilis]
MKLMTSNRGIQIQIVVWILVFITAVPPTLLAQTGIGGPSGLPIPYGTLPDSPGSILPGQPIVTNPDALKPITHNQVPCLAQGGPGATAPPVTPEVLGQPQTRAAGSSSSQTG